MVELPRRPRSFGAADVAWRISLRASVFTRMSFGPPPGRASGGKTTARRLAFDGQHATFCPINSSRVRRLIKPPIWEQFVPTTLAVPNLSGGRFLTHWKAPQKPVGWDSPVGILWIWPGVAPSTQPFIGRSTDRLLARLDCFGDGHECDGPK